MQDYSGYGLPPAEGGGYGGPTSPLPQGPPPPPPPRRRIGLLSYLGVALAAGALGAGTVVAIYHPTASTSAAPLPSSTAIPAVPQPSPSSVVPLPIGGSGISPAEAAVVKKVSPGLVIINTTLQYSSEEAAGTGMVLKSDGLVLTNNHVIENATKISATVLSTGRTYPAKVVGYDVTGDVAEIQLQGASGLHTIPVGDSSKVKVGASVVALGNAEGQSQIVAAPGQIKALNQSIIASDQGGTVSSENLQGMFETDANIVAGDSGGPLADAAGQVIGMDTAGNGGGFSQQQSTSGYAIPIATALSVARQISAGHASSTVVIGYPPFIGIYIGKGTTTSPQAQAAQQQDQSGFPSIGGAGNGSGSGSGGNASCYTSDSNLTTPATIASVSSGTLVLGTICGSPASSAGLTAGSVITGVNGQTVGSPQSLTTIMSKFRPGTHVSLSWVTPSSQDKTGTLILTAGPPL
jgi:S1-C subfamily serine protease